jgi:hypothetical protein
MNAIAKTLAAAALVAGLCGSANAEALKLGVLNCTIDASYGLIIGSSTSLNCQFDPAGGGKSAFYQGTISKLGLNIGYTSKSYVTWIVLAAGKVNPDAIAGDYVGASADASVGLGLGANALIGGFRQTVGLQPLSVQGQQGLNIAVGVTGLNLERVGK